ncbi:hypothetical protein JTB14_016163 [Gonioctena quinquepunctata]|nr:hypothetical protein JTB14_016163 [Gonioctena quinquepunctata]
MPGMRTARRRQNNPRDSSNQSTQSIQQSLRDPELGQSKAHATQLETPKSVNTRKKNILGGDLPCSTMGKNETYTETSEKSLGSLLGAHYSASYILPTTGLAQDPIGSHKKPTPGDCNFPQAEQQFGWFHKPSESYDQGLDMCLTDSYSARLQSVFPPTNF